MLKTMRLLFLLLVVQTVWAQHEPASKKGVAFNTSYKASWPERFEALKPFWHYSWNWEYSSSYPEGVQFVPMVWGKSNATQDRISYLNNLAADEKISHVLTFNEPDLEGQANLTVDEAISYWSLFETLHVSISSPATSAPLNAWMLEFMEKATAQGLRIDFIPIHIYHKNTAQKFLDLVAEVYQRFQKPIWITEFALKDPMATVNQPNRYSEQEALDFMKAVLEGLEALPYVHRYAWFDPNASHPNYPKVAVSDLITETNQLTSLGAFYAAHSPSNDLAASQLKEMQQVFLYPNPCVSYVHVELADPSEFNIVNLLGDTIKKGYLHEGKNTIDVSSLPKGMYFLQLFSSNGSHHKQLFIH
jgi:hypothetical protein